MSTSLRVIEKRAKIGLNPRPGTLHRETTESMTNTVTISTSNRISKDHPQTYSRY